MPDMPRTGEGYNVHVTGLTHDERGYPDMTPAVQDKLVRRLQDKIQKNADKITLYEEDQIEGAEVVVVSYGITSRVAQRAIEMARQTGREGRQVPPHHRVAVPREENCGNRRQGEGNCRRGAEPGTDGARGRTRRCRQSCLVRFVGHAGGSVHRPEDILQAIMEVAR